MRMKAVACGLALALLWTWGLPAYGQGNPTSKLSGRVTPGLASIGGGGSGVAQRLAHPAEDGFLRRGRGPRLGRADAALVDVGQ